MKEEEAKGFVWGNLREKQEDLIVNFEELCLELVPAMSRTGIFSQYNVQAYVWPIDQGRDRI